MPRQCAHWLAMTEGSHLVRVHTVRQLITPAAEEGRIPKKPSLRGPAGTAAIRDLPLKGERIRSPRGPPSNQGRADANASARIPYRTGFRKRAGERRTGMKSGRKAAFLRDILRESYTCVTTAAEVLKKSRRRCTLVTLKRERGPWAQPGPFASFMLGALGNL